MNRKWKSIKGKHAPQLNRYKLKKSKKTSSIFKTWNENIF